MTQTSRIFMSRPRTTSALLFAAVVTLLTLFAGSTASSSRAAVGCSLYAANAGSDSNDGSSARPFATAAKLLAALAPGQTGCLTAGQTFTGDLNLSKGGTASAHVTVTSTDSSNPATIFGRVVTHPGANYLTFTNLKFNWNSGGQNLPSITVASDNLSLTYDDIQNGNTSICINVIDDSTWGTAHNTLIDHNRIHNCGQRPVTSYTSPGYFSHGLYIIGINTTVTNNYIYDISGKAVLLRGSTGAYVGNNTIDNNGTGVAFGDMSASNNEVAHNIITNSSAGCSCNTFGVFSWWGSATVGTGNTFHDNLLSGNQGGDIFMGGGGFTATNNTIATPLYTNRAAKDFSLLAGSPGTGDGAIGTPGPNGSGTVTPPPPPPAQTVPSNTTAPSISGSTQVGTSLNATSGSWNGSAPIAYGYQWQRCATAGVCATITGATSAGYTSVSGDVGSTLRVAVSAANPVGSVVVMSSQTAAVTSTPVTTPPTTSGAFSSPVLDNFNRTGPAAGSTWTPLFSGEAAFTLGSQQAVGASGDYRAGSMAGASFGPNVETYATMNNDVGVNLFARITSPGTSSVSGYSVEFHPNLGSIYVYRITKGTYSAVLGGAIKLSFARGAQAGMRVIGNTISAWVNTGTGWKMVGSRMDSTYTSGGFIGAELYGGTNRSFDDFGGGTAS